MILFLGITVGGIVISMYMPLFSLIGQLSPLTEADRSSSHGPGVRP